MIDSHCHLDFSPLRENIEELLKQCRAVGITDIILPGTEPQQWHILQQLARYNHPVQLHACAGLHPWWVDRQTLSQQDFVEQLRVLAADSVAIGECGLDGSIDCPLSEQEAWLRLQIEVACDLGMPLVLHVHKAHNDILRLLAEYRPAAGGVVHGFAGSPQLAGQYWRHGFHIGVGGTITYNRARKTRAAIEALPMGALLLETDAPDMPLCGAQGRANSPLQLPKVADSLAVLKNLSQADVIMATNANTRSLFGL